MTGMMTLKPSRSRGYGLLSKLMLLLLGCSVSAQAQNYITLQNGYLYDPAAGEAYVPIGVNYQLWNNGVFVYQTNEQVLHDLRELKAMGITDLRTEFIWSEIETTEGVYDFAKYNWFLDQCEALGFRLFVVIGWDFPPTWAATNHPDWMAVSKNPNDGGSLITEATINYNNPAARQAYADFIGAVATQYSDRDSIIAWILGNEFAFYNTVSDPLIYPNRPYYGFDTAYSIPAYEAYLTGEYGNIAALNAAWATSHASFADAAAAMPYLYPERSDALATQQSGYYDLLQWRKQVIGDYIAAGALAAKTADPNHLITYSKVGGIFDGIDSNITCEDAKIIVERCELAGAPLDFFTINNYPILHTSRDDRSLDYGVRRYADNVGIPVMVSETGLSSEDNIWPEVNGRYDEGLHSAPWESLMSGAIGVYMYVWQDRTGHSGGVAREATFGLIGEDRLSKGGAFENVVKAFRRMQEIQIHKLLSQSQRPQPDILVYKSADHDTGFNRWNQEVGLSWAAFKRAGYYPMLINDEIFDRLADGNPDNDGIYGDAQAIFLPRNYAMDTARLDALDTSILNDGWSLHAANDIPGRFNPHHAPNSNWVSRSSSIFGLDVSAATPALDSFDQAEAGGWPAGFERVVNTLQSPLGPLNSNLPFITWKLWHGVGTTQGTSIYTHRGINEGQATPIPGLHVTNANGNRGATAIQTFSIGDISVRWDEVNDFGVPWSWAWDVRYRLIRGIYESHFGISPRVNLSQTSAQGNAAYVTYDLREFADGSVLLSLLNMANQDVSFNLQAAPLIAGLKVEDLTHGTILSTSSTGEEAISMTPDEFILLYAYGTDGSNDDSLANSFPGKLYVNQAPTRVWPAQEAYSLEVAYDTNGLVEDLKVEFLQVDGGLNTVRSTSALTSVNGSGTASVDILIPDADLSDPSYGSSRGTSRYVFRVSYDRGGVATGAIEIPVELLFALKPQTLPTSLTAGDFVTFSIDWEDLPSYLSSEFLYEGHPTLLERADVWPSTSNNTVENYNLTLELLDNTQSVVATAQVHNTSFGNGSHDFQLLSPITAAQGEFDIRVRAEAPVSGGGASITEIVDSFEGLTPGEWTRPQGDPWTLEHFEAAGAGVVYTNDGVHGTIASDGSNSLYANYTSHTTGWAVFRYRQDFDTLQSLPADRSQVIFSADFAEANGVGVDVVLEVIDSSSNLLSYTQSYNLGPQEFMTVSATLDQFQEQAGFDPDAVQSIAVRVTMLQTSTLHIGYFDNIRFQAVQAGETHTYVYDSSNDGAAGSSSFNDWQGTHFSPGEIGNPDGSAGFNGDFDGDGLSNGVEFAFGTDPRANDGRGSSVLTQETVGGAQHVSYTVTVRSAPDVTYTLETSNQLSTGWAEASGSYQLVSTTDAGGGMETRHYRALAPLSAGERSFLRLRVSSP